MTRVLILSLAMLLVLPGTLAAGETLYLSRTLDLDFRHPGKIQVVTAKGRPPVHEMVGKNSHLLILPKRIKMILAIANANEDRHHYHICVEVVDELRPTDRTQIVISPDQPIKMLWLGCYRYQFTIIRKHAVGENRFVTAQVRLDVYALGDK